MATYAYASREKLHRQIEGTTGTHCTTDRRHVDNARLHRGNSTARWIRGYCRSTTKVALPSRDLGWARDDNYDLASTNLAPRNNNLDKEADQRIRVGHSDTNLARSDAVWSRSLDWWRLKGANMMIWTKCATAVCIDELGYFPIYITRVDSCIE
jgi:hypothetical protein